MIDKTKMTSDFQIKSALKNQNSEIEEFIPVIPSNALSKMSSPVTAASTVTSSENATLPIVYLLNVPMSTQHVENSSNHLNGSILTVMSSNTLLTSSPDLVRNSISSTLTPISSIGGTECVSSKASNHPLLYSFKDSSLECKSIPKRDSKAPVYISETAKSKSSYLHQSKVLELSNTDTTCQNIPPKLLRSDCELNSLKCSSQIDNLFYKKSCLFRTKRYIDIANQITPSIFKSAENHLMLLNPNSTITSTARPVAEKSDYLNSESSLPNVLNKPKDAHSAALPSNNECSEISKNSQIHITNTVHQSGAQISMASFSQLNQDSFGSPLHVQEFFANQSFSDEHIKIKEEPPDLLPEQNFEESEYSDFSPTIINVASLNTDKSPAKEEITSVLSIKKEKVESDAEENESSVHLSTNVYQNPEKDDEDKQFLLSLLPELKQLPIFFKNKLKREIQDLVTSFKISEICRKKRKL